MKGTLKVNINGLDSDFKYAIQEILDILPIEISDAGIEITAFASSHINIIKKDRKIQIGYSKKSEFFRALKILAFRINSIYFPYSEESCFEDLAFMADNSRNAVFKIDTAKKLIKHLAIMGYNQLQLYTEDTYEVENEPFFGYMRGRYSGTEIKEIDNYANKFGIELVPCVQTLSHLRMLKRWQCYNALFDYDDILQVKNEETYGLIDKMFASLAKLFTSRKVNIGMDEAYMLGRGVYADKNGIEKTYDIMVYHLNRVNEIVKKYGFTPMMWSDMFFNSNYYSDENLEEVKSELPQNVKLIYWDYYHLDEKTYDKCFAKHAKYKNEIIFAGGAWKWRGFTPQNRFSIQASRSAIASCKRNNINNIIITAWGDNGSECSIFGILPTLCYVSELAYNNGDGFELAFKEVSGVSLKNFMALDLPNVINESYEVNTFNPSKYMLYNDYFLGLYDCTVKTGDGQIFKSHIEALKVAEKKAKRWKYLFVTLRKLCEILYIKYELGILTRVGYRNNDKAEIKRLIDYYYLPLIKKINSFLKIFRTQWNIENKPFGFEIQDIRLGGLIERTKSCCERLKNFVNGDIERIEELDESLLDVLGGKNFREYPMTCCSYADMVSPADKFPLF